MNGGMPMGGGFGRLMSSKGGAGPKTAPNPLTAGVGGGEDGEGSWGRRIGGALSGFGQGLMDPGMRKTFDTAGSGGYNDLMQKQKIGDFVRTGAREKSGDVLGRGVGGNPNMAMIK